MALDPSSVNVLVIDIHADDYAERIGKQFPGMNADMVTWVGALGADYGIIAVGKDSKYQTLNDLMAAVKANPKSVKFAGGSARGGWDHLKVLIAAKAAGADQLPSIPYLSYNNGGEAMTQVVGGHVDAFTGELESRDLLVRDQSAV